jgi:hypothetical protein
VPCHPHAEAAPLPADEPVPLVIAMEPLCAHLAATDRLRLGASVVRHEEIRQPSTVTLQQETTVWLPRVS